MAVDTGGEPINNKTARFSYNTAEKDRAMNPLIMKALFEGFAVLIGSFVRTAASKGFSIMLLVIGFGGVVWFASWQRGQMLEEIRETKTECRSEIENLEKRLSHCEEQREKQAIDIAVMKVEIRALTASKKK